MGTIEVHKRYFTEDDISDGDILTDYEPVEVVECEDTEDAVSELESRGLCGRYTLSVHPVPETFTGHEWLSLPDGSVIVDHYTGKRMEMSAHLKGWSDEDFATIIRTVTSD